jgi:hypothetical protein
MRIWPVCSSSLQVKGWPMRQNWRKMPADSQSSSNQRTNTNMKIHSKAITLAALILTFALAFGLALGGEQTVAGKWKGQFDSQIGIQKYTFEFKVDGTNLTGKAIGEREMGTNEVAITEGKVSTNEIFFIEPLKFDDNELRIEYKGEVSGDEIKFHRKVGDFAEEDFVVKRVKEAEARPEPKPEAKAEAQPQAKAATNSPPAKP